MMRHGGEVRRIAGEAAEFGIKSGFTIPIRTGFGRIALLSLASERTEPDRVAIRDETHAATRSPTFTSISCVDGMTRCRPQTLRSRPGRSRASIGRQ
ncbi:autoinducer binding domain-containing protein [Mesorhizobium sp. M0408]|uniref:autoinducer binding domain-containing protein n=1 Tax=Mesorhizobium sp. M0408 TaxID=2956942 RepID=UPI00333B23E0